MRTVKTFIVPIVVASSVLLTGCSNNMMDNVMDKGKKVNDVKEEVVEDEIYQLDDEDMEALAKAESITAEQAIEASKDNLEKVKLLDSSKVPAAKDKFTDSTEFALYISNLFYKYHTKAIDGNSFYKAMEPHMAKEFEELFPTDLKEREEFLASYPNDLSEDSNKFVSYEVSEVKSIQLDVQRYFYRKYTYEDGKELYYLTNIRQNDDTGAWEVIDDDFSPGYSVEQ